MKAILLLCVTMLCITLPFAVSQASTSAKENAADRKVMHDYARCVVKANHDRASAAIIADSDNETIVKRYPELMSSVCMSQTGGNVQVRFGGDLYRYALADALVNADFADRRVEDFSNRLPLAHLLPPSQVELDADLAKTKSKSKQKELQERFSKQYAVTWLSQYGECVVRRDPIKALFWLLTPPNGPEEISRINDLSSDFNACLGDGTIKFNRITMRGTIAINYYRLAMATAQPVVGKAH